MSEYIYEETPSGSDVFGRPVDAPMLTRREEIVRCRDCKHRTKEPDPWECGPVTPERWVDWCCFMHRELRSLYGYCAWGVKRKEGGE